MITKEILRSSFRFLPLYIIGMLLVSGCTPEGTDPCDNTKAANKYVNLRASVLVKNIGSNQPVVGADLLVTLTQLACGGDTVKVITFADTTGLDGIYTADLTNFVLKNYEDRVEIYAVAPNLNFHLQNFSKIVRKYNELAGAGSEDINLTINEAAQ
jgi:hypothetical protein